MMIFFYWMVLGSGCTIFKVFGVLLAPGGEDSLFKQFKDIFPTLDVDDLQLFEDDHYVGLGCKTWFSYQSEVIRNYCEQLNITQDWVREDYRELNELLIIFFHGTVSPGYKF